MESVLLLLAALAVLYFVFTLVSNGEDASTQPEAGKSPQGDEAHLIDTTSPNGRYRVMVTEPDRSVVLEHTEKGVLWTKTLQRPNGASVSDDGTVIVENWGSSDPSLTSEVFAFDRRGETLLEEGYDALVRDSGIDADGNVAWFATANAAASSDRGDGDQLFVYDLDERRRLLKTDSPMMEIERVGTSGRVIDVVGDGFHCRYRDGEMINPESFQWAKEERKLEEATTPNTVASVAKQRVERAEQLSEDQLRSTIEAARRFDGSGSDRTWAKLWRRKGELHEHLGEKRQALQDYEQARSLDENVGVDRKARRLRDEVEE